MCRRGGGGTGVGVGVGGTRVAVAVGAMGVNVGVDRASEGTDVGVAVGGKGVEVGADTRSAGLVVRKTEVEVGTGVNGSTMLAVGIDFRAVAGFGGVAVTVAVGAGVLVCGCDRNCGMQCRFLCPGERQIPVGIGVEWLDAQCARYNAGKQYAGHHAKYDWEDGQTANWQTDLLRSWATAPARLVNEFGVTAKVRSGFASRLTHLEVVPRSVKLFPFVGVSAWTLSEPIPPCPQSFFLCSSPSTASAPSARRRCPHHQEDCPHKCQKRQARTHSPLLRGHSS